jgi:hypothetical protein
MFGQGELGATEVHGGSDHVDHPGVVAARTDGCTDDVDDVPNHGETAGRRGHVDGAIDGAPVVGACFVIVVDSLIDRPAPPDPLRLHRGAVP